MAKENQKQLTELSQHISIEVASPKSFKGMIFNYNVSEELISGLGWKIRLYNKWIPPNFPEAAYVFRSLDLGMKDFGPDIVHIEADPFSPVFINSFFVTRFWAPKAKIVCTIKQNTYTSRGKVIDGLKDFAARRLVPQVDHFLTVNQGVADIYLKRFGANPEKMTYCTHLGVDTNIFAPGKEGEKPKYYTRFCLERGEALLGYCGRLIDYKGVSDLIAAVKHLREQSQRDFRLCLLGDGPMKEELHTLIKDLPWLQLVPPIPHAEVADFLKALDVFVMPSRILPWHLEHDAHALLEAMSSGLPCIATRCGANEDVLSGVGMLVEPRGPETLSDAMGALLSNEDHGSMLGRAARQEVIEKYSIAAVAQIYLGIYKQVLS